MKYLIIDGQLHGTGIRDYYQGGFINPENLGLDDATIKRVEEWLLKYKDEHYNSFENLSNVDILDIEGIRIAEVIKNQLHDMKIDYYSAAKMTKVNI